MDPEALLDKIEAYADAYAENNIDQIRKLMRELSREVHAINDKLRQLEAQRG